MMKGLMGPLAAFSMICVDHDRDGERTGQKKKKK
jgi:hypothetical protein